MKPDWGLAIVTCMDARLDPWRIVGAEAGDVHVIRNAGGVVTEDVIRSLVASTRMLGVTRVQVIMHTDCGMEGLDGKTSGTELEHIPIDLRGFPAVVSELRRGVARILENDHVSVPDGVTGHVFDVHREQLTAIV